jgi:hypothetical protein
MDSTAPKNIQTFPGEKGGHMNNDINAEEINELQKRDTWGNQHQGLACRLVCHQEEIKPGERISFEFKLRNIGDRDLLIPLCFFDQESRALVVGSEEEIVGSTGTCLLVRSDQHGNLMFDNFGYRSFMPDMSWVKISPGETLSTNFAIDDSSTFVTKKGESIELFGGVDHCGLTVEGTYFFRMMLNVGKSEKDHWHGRMESNEVSIVVK